MDSNFDELASPMASQLSLCAASVVATAGMQSQSSILMPTIPIFHLQQRPSAAISMLDEQTQTAIDDVNKSTANAANSFLNIDVSSELGVASGNTRSSFNCGNNAADLNIDWSNSLFRPASRFTISNRRECKSTSDETHIFELNNSVQANRTVNEMQAFTVKKTNFLISPPNYNSSAASNRMQFSSSTTGQFGFNPNSLKLLNSTLTSLNGSALNSNTNSNGLSEKLANCSFKFTSVSNKDKKSVKRLTGNTKFSIDSMSKKHHDFNHNKKLFHAVSNNDYKTVVELLTSNMYDVNCCDDKQRTCLHIASSRGNLEIVRLLLDYGSNPNIRDCVSNLPIHLAIISSHVPVVTVLLEAGTDIHSLDLNGKTVLHLAGTRLRWLLNDENHKASPKLKIEAIMIMNMIKEYLRRKKASTADLDTLADKLESVFNLDDINNITMEFLDKFETLNIKTNIK